MKDRITGREIDLLNVFWSNKEPMTARQIAAASDELSINTIQVVIKSLLKKKCISVADIVYSGTVLARTYKVDITKTEFIESLFSAYGMSNDVFEVLINEITDPEKLKAIEKLIRKQKKIIEKSEL